MSASAVPPAAPVPQPSPSPVGATAFAPGCAVRREDFGRTPDGVPVERFVLTSPSGVSAAVLSYGAVLQSLRVPGPGGGGAAEVVLGLPDVPAYAGQGDYLGAVVGRYANRIRGGAFTLDGTVHRIPVNDRGNALHGGPEGFDRRVWAAEPVRRPDGAAAVRLSLVSPDGDQGFPGALSVAVEYRLDRDGTLAVDYRATTDRPTVAALTQHAYFNLSGRPGSRVLDHLLTVDADGYLPVDDGGVPLAGPPVPVAGTPFDFTAPHPIGERIAAADPQLSTAGGYDHCWALRGRAAGRGQVLRRAARLEDPGSGRVMEVWTGEPGLQVYSGNQLAGGGPHGRHAGVCLETQAFPDAPNRPDYPSAVLRPGEVLRSRTELDFPHLAPRTGP
ncbi:aldose epimerase family protein [Streptomyces lichenis]|uniref:Aldose 1-epimerase n=1 Tax=Streptomyces lichenis TaxID=2306967 RepID=A0ABT0I8G3_9ACTN|nr:aldose epimerase family protein [Streptomyces lichenis]MCK8677596.1 galactose mutarotase [Streptomyces lichenis]